MYLETWYETRSIKFTTIVTTIVNFMYVNVKNFHENQNRVHLNKSLKIKKKKDQSRTYVRIHSGVVSKLKFSKHNILWNQYIVIINLSLHKSKFGTFNLNLLFYKYTDIFPELLLETYNSCFKMPLSYNTQSLFDQILRT